MKYAEDSAIYSGRIEKDKRKKTWKDGGLHNGVYIRIGRIDKNLEMVRVLLEK